MSSDSVAAFAGIASIEHVVASPDRTHIAFTWARTGHPELYVVESGGGEPHQLTNGTLPQDFTHVPAIWHPDSDRLIVREGQSTEDTDLASVTLNGTTKPVATCENECLPWDVSPDGDQLLYRTREDDTSHVWRRDLTTGQDTHVYEFDQLVSLCAGGYDPAGERVILHEHRDGATPLLFATDAFEDPTPLEIGGRDDHVLVKAWHPDGDRLLVHDGEGYLTGRAGVHDLRTGETEWWTPDGKDERPLTFRGNGGIVANNWRSLVVYDGDQNRGEYQVEGNVLVQPAVSTGVLTDNGVVFARRTPRRPFELVQYTPESESVKLLVEAEYGPLTPTEFVDPECVAYEAANGDLIDGILYRPDDDPAPVVAELYSGRTTVAPRFTPLFQLLVHNGYAVFRPGNTGGAFAKSAQEDYAAAARWLTDQDWTAGVAAYGHSHGGYDVAYQLGRYDCWDAGIAYNGLLDLEATAENGDLLPTVVRALGDPDKNADRYAQQNPRRFVDRVSDPLLVLHGTDDPACPLYQAKRYREALEAAGLSAGTDFEYYQLEGHGHASRSADEQAMTWRRLLAFLNQRL